MTTFQGLKLKLLREEFKMWQKPYFYVFFNSCIEVKWTYNKQHIFEVYT